MVTQKETKLEDLIGLEYARLGFFKEVQIKIGELQASNMELELKRQEIQAILDGITDIMAVISLDFKIISVNHVFFDFFDYKDPEGAFCYQVFRHQDYPCVSCPMVTAKNNNQVCRQTEIYPIKGKNRHFEITASPLRDAKGQPVRILLVKRDVTREKEYQDKYYHAEKMATIGLLAAGVAHEINNPLTAISGFAEGLNRRMPRLKASLKGDDKNNDLIEDFQEYVETILTECNRCRDIVRSLLKFSPRKILEFSPVDLNRLILDVLKLLYHELKHYPPDIIKLELDKDIPKASGIEAELKQVILNLVLNALDAIQEHGTITIRTCTKQDSLLLIVQDTGYGIPNENLNRLFEPFFTTKPVGKGIGIGLSNSYNIIRQHHGEIFVESDHGKGAIFKVKLPGK